MANTRNRGSRIILPRLGDGELKFIAEIVNTAADGDWLSVEKKAQRQLGQSQRLVLWPRDRWGDPLKTDYGKERLRLDRPDRVQTPREWSEYHSRHRWKNVREILNPILIDQRDSPGFYCSLPLVALPEKKPRFAIHDPDDLARWLVARMAANRQWHAIVKCERCKRFGVHGRARRGMKYCTDCKVEANRDRAIKRYQARQRYPTKDMRRYKQLNKLEHKSGKLSAPLKLEKWALQAKPSRPIDRARVRALREVLDVPNIPEFCPTCSTSIDKHLLTFAKELRHTSGDYENVWYCQRCSQVVRTST